MLKWAKNKHSNKAMSGVVKQRGTAPTTTLDKPQNQSQSNSDTKRTTNGSATLSYPSEATDDVNMNEVDGLVALDVTLPDGQHMDITVDYNTPMLDLLVCLAGKSKLSPPGLLLQLVSEDSGTPLAYKPNQVIGALGGRHVRLIDKKAQEAEKKKGKKQQPFEMTHRFTVNLPLGQKAVHRVSPAMSVGSIMTSVCQEKDLDPRRHVLQLPGKPGMPVDLNATVGQLGVFEINLIHITTLQERNHTSSMPDLSQVPTYMPGAGELKKKRGFLSFLSKKDKKFKPHETLYAMETSSTTSHRMNIAQNRKSASPPLNQRRVSDTGLESSRPKSMFVASNPDSTELSLPQKENKDSHALVAPARKKRRAPAPPTVTDSVKSSDSISSSKQDINANDNENKPSRSHNETGSAISTNTTSVASNQRETSSVTTKSQTAHSRAEMLSRLHSRNSSDSSGYHELTLSGCESPEAGHNMVSKSKTSIDSASIESSDINNGVDSGIHESPVRVSPIEEVLEKTDTAVVSQMPVNHVIPAIQSSTLPLPSKKKKKAPAPPIPMPIPTPQPPTQKIEAESIKDDLPIQDAESVHESQKTEYLQLSVSSEIQLTNDEPISDVISPPASFSPDDTTATQTTSTPLHMTEDPNLSDEDIDVAFDIDDILSGVTFDDEPKPLKLKTFTMLNDNTENDDEGAMMMMETSSIASENIEQDDAPPKSDRPCAFIPPPPPTEPPPPEVETVYVEGLSKPPILIDKETEVNDDNTSLAPSSIKNSPETVSPDGYKNEMALFVERMSKMAMENQEGEGNQLNDSLSSGVSVSETNSDTGSVIQHLRTDSGDSKTGFDAGSWSKKDVKIINGIKEEIEESSSFKVSEEITAPVATVPPPPEFGDEKGEEPEDIDGDDDEEEEYTETIEELIIPLGPNGYDFSAARKLPDLETSKEPVQNSPKEMENTNIKNGVFRAEPVSIKPVSTQPEAKKEKEQIPQKAAEKEEFILTTDDLSSVSFLPPRPKLAQRISNPEPEKPKNSVSSKVLIMAKSKTPGGEEDISAESIQSRVSQLSFTPRSEPETDPMLEVKSISLLNRPTTVKAAEIQDSPREVISISKTSYQPNVLATPESSREITIQSNTSNLSDSADEIIDSSFNSVLNSHSNDYVDDAEERPDSRASNQSLDQREQQSQYDMLQIQFARWQEQLAQNQNILSQATGNELQSDQLQQLTAQMTMQQNMMLQIQSTMQALQQHMVNGGNGDNAASVEFPPLDVEQAAAAAEPPAPPLPPPAPPAPAASGTKAVDNSKSGQMKTKSRPKPKFERELDPREQLMIAIRNFQGREGLKSVAKKDTKWIHSNR